jgi:hypothetical protein
METLAADTDPMWLAFHEPVEPVDAHHWRLACGHTACSDNWGDDVPDFAYCPTCAQNPAVAAALRPLARSPARGA